MKRSKLIMWIVVAIAAGLIIWRVGFYPPVPAVTEKPAETEVADEWDEWDEWYEWDQPDELQALADAGGPLVASDVTEPAKSADVNEPEAGVDANQPRFAQAGERRGPGRRPGQMDMGGDFRRSGRITDANDANQPMEALNLKNVEMKDIVRKIAEWTGKTVIPSEDAEKVRVSIYAPDQLPRSKALAHIYGALRVKGFIIEHLDDAIYISPVKGAKLGFVPTILADQPLAALENKDQIVEKFFKLKNYSPAQMAQVVQPLVGEYGHVSADETTSTLLVIDTVGNLMRIERIIAEFDVSQVGKTVTQIFEVHNGDPQEIVRLLETLLGSGASTSAGSGGRGGQGPPWASPRPTVVSGGSSSSSGKGGAATSVVVGTSRTPMVLIAEPKYHWIIAKASPEDMEQIDAWIKRLDRSVPTMLADYPLAKIENKNQVVQKFFKLENYSPAQMAQVIGPLLSESGYVTGDETTGNLVVIDTVENLIRVEIIIDQFDVPEAEQTVTQTFEVLHGDPAEIVQLLRLLLSDGTGATSRASKRSSSYGGSSSYSKGGMFVSSPGDFMSSGAYRSSARPGGTTSVLVGPSQMPIVLIPEPKRKLIIARASAEDMKLIDEWITKLDKKEPGEREYETIPIRYADVSEVATRLNEAFREMPGTELEPSVLIQAMVQARQIVVFGREDLRSLVKKLIEEIDVPTGLFQTEHFKLKYADPDQIKKNIDDLYGQTSTTGSRYTSIYYFSGYQGRGGVSADTVKAISYVSLKQVTVIASAENMEKIREQIKEWDAPIDVNELRPRIVELRNSDPVKMADLLKTLFSEQTTSGFSIYEYIFGYGTEEKQKIIGPLYGQLTFENVPGTKKIIVISKIPEAYDVVEQLILDLDKEEMAQVPKVITLKYADPEDLAERLNALFNEMGTTAAIRRSEQGLSEYSTDGTNQGTSTTTGGGTSASRTTGGTSTGGTTSTAEYRPWWNTGRTSTTEEPISNVIGKVRFIPDIHSKSILVLAPPQFMANIEQMIHDLDLPGKQVLIKAVIVEVDHSSMTSLGLQLASDPSAFGSLSENAIRALNQLTYLETHAAVTAQRSATTGLGPGVVGTGSGTVLGTGADVYALLDFLVKKVNAKVLNQQTLWTKDNEEAMFFKGQTVAFLAGSSASVGVATQDVEFQDVGMTLQARPSITPEKNVDMRVRVVLSQITAEVVNNQPVRSRMNTESNMIVQDGQTIMLGGILFQEDSLIERKIPLLGDIPLAGGLFRHNQTVQANTELIVFITPYVIDEPGKMLPETLQEIAGPRQKLADTKEQLENMKAKLESNPAAKKERKEGIE